MPRVLALTLLLIVVGTAVVALPDDDRRLFSISRDHGPSPLDAAGTALVLAGWTLAVHRIWQRRREVQRRLHPVGVAAASAAVLAGLVLVFWSVLGNHGAWWVVGIVLAVMPQFVALIAAR